MATHRALQAAGMTVTASAPMSGPYALEALGDAVFFGQVNLASTVFTPLTGHELPGGRTATSTRTPPMSTRRTTRRGWPTCCPASPRSTPCSRKGFLPQTALFSSTTPVTGNPTLDAELAVPANPVFAAGFGTGNLVTNDYRLAYVLDAVANPDGAVPPSASVAPAANPQNPLRIAFRPTICATGRR